MARLATGRWARSLTGGPLSPGFCSTRRTVVDGPELFSWLSGAVFLRMAHLETAKEAVEYSQGANFRWSFRNCRCVGHYFRALIFPWAVLFLMVPLPAILFNQVALPLQFLASRLASGLLELVGVPVLREGNVINLPSLSLDVAEACSGLRSLVSLITISVLYGYVFESRVSRRLLLVLSSVPIAVAANGIRIAGSGILGQYWDPSKAEGFYHLLSGWLIFVLCLGLLMLFHAILRLTGPRAQSRHV